MTLGSSESSGGGVVLWEFPRSGRSMGEEFLDGLVPILVRLLLFSLTGVDPVVGVDEGWYIPNDSATDIAVLSNVC